MKTVLTLTALATATALAAQGTPSTGSRLSSEYRACQTAADNAQTNGAQLADDTIACLDPELARQDARLNQAYKMVMMRLSAQRKTQLRGQQRAWIAERDRSCDRDLAGGAIGPMLDAKKCRLEKTISRTMWLERYR